MKRVTARALAALVAAMLLVAFTAAGRTFLYCASMGVSMDRCCCSHPDAQQSSDPGIDRGACCEVRAVACPLERSSAPALASVAPALGPAQFELPLPPPGAALVEAPVRLRLWSRPGAPAVPRGPPYRLNCAYLI
jgi:hypothetical protein